MHSPASSVGLRLLQPVPWWKVLSFGFDESHGDRLGIRVHFHAQDVIHSPSGLFLGFALNNLNSSGGFFASDEVFRPTPLVQAWVNEFGSGVGFTYESCGGYSCGLVYLETASVSYQSGTSWR